MRNFVSLNDILCALCGPVKDSTGIGEDADVPELMLTVTRVKTKTANTKVVKQTAKVIPFRAPARRAVPTRSAMLIAA